MPSVASGVLLAVGVFSIAKIGGYALCVVIFGLGRLVLVGVPGSPVGKVGRRASSAPTAR